MCPVAHASAAERVRTGYRRRAYWACPTHTKKAYPPQWAGSVIIAPRACGTRGQEIGRARARGSSTVQGVVLHIRAAASPHATNGGGQTADNARRVDASTSLALRGAFRAMRQGPMARRASCLMSRASRMWAVQPAPRSGKASARPMIGVWRTWTGSAKPKV